MNVLAGLSLTVVSFMFLLGPERVHALVPQINEPNRDRSQLFHKMERHIPRDTFVRGERSTPSTEHEVLIAIRQNNLPTLKKSILERATPGHALYQKWLTFHEIGAIVQNQDGYEKVKRWLEENAVNITWVAPYKEYIQATASIGIWERLLRAEFYQHEDLTRRKGLENIGDSTVYHRAVQYSIPTELKESIDSVFHTVQTPPRYDIRYGKHPFYPEASGKRSSFRTDYTVSTDSFSSSKGYERRKNVEVQQIGDDVDVDFLNRLYRVNSNIGSASISQSVFQTNNEYFRPADLNKFQTRYGLTVQSAATANGHSTSSFCDDEISCGEGNLDIQYIMGMAQKTGSIFWWVPSSGGDPFVTWIKEVVEKEFPPQSNSISWGELEAFVSSSVLNSWETEAMKLAGRGVTIAVASGDSGGPNVYQSCLCPTVVTYHLGFAFFSFSSSFVRLVFQALVLQIAGTIHRFQLAALG
jgi:hypothetical protein